MPSCASKELLNDNMRSKWGFNGYMCAHTCGCHSTQFPSSNPSLPATRSTSDCGAVGNVANAEPSGHGFTHDDSNLTAKTTLEAGMDNDCGELASGLHSSQDARDTVSCRTGEPAARADSIVLHGAEWVPRRRDE